VPDPKVDPAPDAVLERCADPGWTPGARDVAGLLATFERDPDPPRSYARSPALLALAEHAAPPERRAAVEAGV